MGTQEVIDAIPLKHDLFSYMMVPGICLSLLLAGVIFLRAPLRNRSLFWYACLLVVLCIISTDVFLCYTGLIKHMIHLNDLSEFLTLSIGPLLFLIVRFSIKRKPLKAWIVILHFLPAFLYLLNTIPYAAQPLEVKLNAYLGAYFPTWERVVVPEGVYYGYHPIKDHLRWYILSSLFGYGLYSLYLFVQSRRASSKKKKSGVFDRIRFGKYTTIFLVLTFVVLLAIYLRYSDDSGDHFITIFMTLIMLLSTTFFLMESRFFQDSWFLDKYETSSPLPDSLSITQLRKIISSEELFLASDVTLKKMAAQLEIPQHQLSRIINENTGMNFNDFLNQFRIAEASKRLLDSRYSQLTIEAIGNGVGFRSKSAFYAAFKKEKQLSPKEFIKRHSS